MATWLIDELTSHITGDDVPFWNATLKLYAGGDEYFIEEIEVTDDEGNVIESIPQSTRDEIEERFNKDREKVERYLINRANGW